MKAIHRVQQGAERMMDSAIKNFNRCDFESAFDDYEDAVELYPDIINQYLLSSDSSFLYTIGNQYHEKGRYEQAIICFTKVYLFDTSIKDKAHKARQRSYDAMMMNPFGFSNSISNHELTLGQKLLGEGTYGIVTDCTWKGAPAAIKKIVNRSSKQAVSEIEMHRSLSYHSNIMLALGSRTDPLGNHYLIMEYMTGGDLFDLLEKQNQSLSLSVRLSLLKNILDGLVHLHKCDILHRDIKPDNVLLNNRMQAKIGDFGLAIKLQDAENMDPAGSPPYAAPELFQLNGRNTKAADCYSLGMLFFTLMANLQTRRKVNINEAMECIKKNITDISPETSKKIATLICNCIALQIHDRPLATQTLEDLEELLHPQKTTHRCEQIAIMTDKHAAVKMEDAGLKLFSGPARFFRSHDNAIPNKNTAVKMNGAGLKLSSGSAHFFFLNNNQQNELHKNASPSYARGYF